MSYLEREGALLAYQVVGDGAADVLYLGEAASHFDLCWTDPYLHALYERGATFARTAYMQLRGLGLSEPGRGAAGKRHAAVPGAGATTRFGSVKPGRRDWQYRIGR